MGRGNVTYAGTVGLPIRLRVLDSDQRPLDITGPSTKEMILVAPDQSTTTHTATEESNTTDTLEYVTQQADLVAGVMKAYGHVVLPNGFEGRTDPLIITVI